MRSTSLAVLLLFSATSMWAQDGGTGNPSGQVQGRRIEWSTDLAITNNVVWRGFVSNQRTSVQPSITLAFGRLEARSTSVLEFDGRYAWKEHDLELRYTVPLKEHLQFTSGYINYAYPALDSDRFAHEFFCGFDVDGPLEVSMQAFQSVGVSAGSYLNLAISRSFRGARRFPIAASASVGFNRKLYIPEVTFSDAVMTLGTEIPVGASLSISPEVSFSKGLNARYFGNYLTAGLRFAFAGRGQRADGR